MTPGEVILWQNIRKRALGYQLHRQVPIGQFIVDFYCHELMLAIEVDDSSHNYPEVSVNDLERQQKLEKLGVSFLRFDESKVKKEINFVLEVISNWISSYES